MHLDFLEDSHADETRPIDQGRRWKHKQEHPSEKPGEEEKFPFARGWLALVFFNLILDVLFVQLCLIQTDVVEDEIKRGDCQDGDHDDQVEHLEVDEEGGPLAHERVVRLDDILVPVMLFVEVYDPLLSNVELRVLQLCDREAFASPYFPTLLNRQLSFNSDRVQALTESRQSLLQTFRLIHRSSDLLFGRGTKRH